MDLTEILSGIKDIVVTVSAAFAAYIAYKGLTKWKYETDGKAKINVAYEFLESLYTIRFAIHRIRDNKISPFEFPDDRALSQKEIYIHIFSKRWEILEAALAKFRVLTFRMQAYKGKDFEDLILPLHSLFSELNNSINQLIEISSDDPNVEYDIWTLEGAREIGPIVFHVPLLDSAHDSFADRLYRVIRDIEVDVRKLIT